MAERTRARWRLARTATHEAVPTRRGSRDNVCDAQRFRVHGRELLGRGTFGRVLRGTDLETQAPVAVKRFTRAGSGPETESERSTRGALPLAEYAVVSAISPHPNIVQVLGCFTTPENINIVMEMCDGGDLLSVVRAGKATVAQAHALLGELSSALHHLHTHGIVHADVKADNVLLQHGHVKLCDFGSAGRQGMLRGEHVCGTSAYLAPELADAGRVDRSVPYAAGHDVWPFGVIVHGLVTGAFPPWERARPADSEYRAYCARGGHFARHLPPYCALHGRLLSLLEACLAPDPAARCTMAEPLRFFSSRANEACWFRDASLTLAEFRAQFCEATSRRASLTGTNDEQPPSPQRCARQPAQVLAETPSDSDQQPDDDDDDDDDDETYNSWRLSHHGDSAEAPACTNLQPPDEPLGRRSQSFTLTKAHSLDSAPERRGSMGNLLSALLRRFKHGSPRPSSASVIVPADQAQ